MPIYPSTPALTYLPQQYAITTDAPVYQRKFLVPNSIDNIRTRL